MTVEQVRENRLRRMAERQGLRVVKSRRRDPLARGFGTFTLLDENGATIAGPGLSDDELEEALGKGLGR